MHRTVLVSISVLGNQFASRAENMLVGRRNWTCGRDNDDPRRCAYQLPCLIEARIRTGTRIGARAGSGHGRYGLNGLDWQSNGLESECIDIFLRPLSTHQDETVVGSHCSADELRLMLLQS